MEILDTIRKILNELEIADPIVDVHYDEQNNIIGFVCSTTFSDLDDMESQNIIWKALKRHLGTEELIKILVIFHETPHDRLLRVSGDEIRVKPINNSLWIHQTPKLSKYWMAVDVCKFDDEYKSTYLVINGDEKFQKGVTFVYTPEIIEFMELNQEEIYDELFSKIFENAESEIKLQVIKKHDELTKKDRWGRDNIYSYVFQSFKLKQLPLSKVIFNENELKLFKKLIGKMEDFTIKTKIQERIALSELMIKNRLTLNT
ncbi:MAG: hypothetical protein OMM_00815 [Candidatus Magnetoglobus multicellularis str. Araruama]|uniref:Uncharacterized protein n=1 Tax=Candidatus Magnetoglobus multicellularis str. Araruama TaxID=890399 RepID=A0A1V1PFQ7_9BACT|nr:MAG: hypothetical protein OMM_00815 [Candidatus Magnetoglobus multicellularis str. Araruama]